MTAWFSRRQVWLIVVGAALVGLAVGLVLFGEPIDAAEAPFSTEEASAPRSIAPVVGGRAPDFELVSLEGERIRLSELLGEVLVLNFWATWCAPCEVEMPSLQALHERLRSEGLRVLAVNFDEAPTKVEAFSDRLQLTFPVLLDPGGEVQRMYRVYGYPTTFIVDREGVIRYRHVGLMAEGQAASYMEGLGFIQ